MSSTFRSVLDTFFSESGFNLETLGVCIEVTDAAGLKYDYWLHAKYEAICADEKALKEVSSTKGASGFKCCQKCANCYNGDPAAVGAMVHYRDPDMGKFLNATPEMYKCMADRLSELASSGCSKAEFNATEQAFGLRYNCHGVIRKV